MDMVLDKNLPILRNEVTDLWYVAYYDGPLRGICSWYGKRCFYVSVMHLTADKTYYLYELTVADGIIEDEGHKLFSAIFEEKSGGATVQHTINLFHLIPEFNPNKSTAQKIFYKRKRIHDDYRERQPVAIWDRYGVLSKVSRPKYT